MLRNVLAVIAGYIVMALIVFTLYTVLLYGLGTEGTYKPGSWEPSSTWLALSFVSGFFAAVIGGWVCVRLSRDARAPLGLMALIVVLGVLSVGLQSANPPPPEVRPAVVSPMEAASKSVPPLWTGIVQIAIGVTGVWVARRMVKRGA